MDMNYHCIGRFKSREECLRRLQPFKEKGFEIKTVLRGKRYNPNKLYAAVYITK